MTRARSLKRGLGLHPDPAYFVTIVVQVIPLDVLNMKSAARSPLRLVSVPTRRVVVMLPNLGPALNA
jgi:hypothetical protein